MAIGVRTSLDRSLITSPTENGCVISHVLKTFESRATARTNFDLNSTGSSDKSGKNSICVGKTRGLASDLALSRDPTRDLSSDVARDKFEKKF